MGFSQATLARHNEFSSTRFARDLLAWYRKHKKQHPWRRDFEATNDAYLVWVSEIILQQTTLAVGTEVYKRFVKAFPDITSLATACPKHLQATVAGVGYYRRFDNMQKAAKILAEASRTMPVTREELLKLPGIGQYTSAAISSIAFGEKQAVCDGNVERVLARIFKIRKLYHDPKKAKAIPELAQAIIPEKKCGDYNQALMELGQTICQPNNPNCTECPVRLNCLCQNTEETKICPGVKPRKQFKEVRADIFLITHAGKVIVVRRQANETFLKNRVGFPATLNLVSSQNKTSKNKEKTNPNLIESANLVGQFRHSITNHKIRAFVYHLSATSSAQAKSYSKAIENDWEETNWENLASIESVIFSNFDKKALKWISH